MARNRSPEATCSRPVSFIRVSACVPLPAPGAPSRMMYMLPYRCVRTPAAPALADESFIVAHQELCLELLHRVDHDADDDQHAGGTDRQRLHACETRREVRQDRDDA